MCGLNLPNVVETTARTNMAIVSVIPSIPSARRGSFSITESWSKAPITFTHGLGVLESRGPRTHYPSCFRAQSQLLCLIGKKVWGLFLFKAVAVPLSSRMLR